MGASLIWPFRLGYRALRRRAGMSLTIVCLAAGAIGLSTVLFSVLDSVVLQVAPYPSAEKLIEINCRERETLGPCPLRLALAVQDDAPSVDESGFLRPGPGQLSYRGGDSLLIATRLVSSSVLSTIGMRPQLGRWFLESDNHDGVPRIVLSDGVWTRLCNRSRSAVGEVVLAGGRPHEVVGVMPSGFTYPHSAVGAWILDPATVTTIERMEVFRWNVVARMRRGMDHRSVRGEVAVLAERLRHSARDNRAVAAEVRPLRDSLLGTDGKLIWLLFAGTVGLVAVVSINVMNLLVALRQESSRETSICRALGATGAQVVLQDVAQALLLAAAASGLALLVASWTLQLFQQLGAFNLSRADLASVGIRAGVYAGGLCVAAMAAASCCATLHTRRGTASIADYNAAALRLSGRSRAAAIQCVCIGVQFCCGLILTVSAWSGAALLHHLFTLPLGFEPKGLFAIATGTFQARGVNVPTDLAEGLRQYLQLQPGVDQVATASLGPLAGSITVNSIVIIRESGERLEGPATRIQIVSDNYFAVLRLPIVAGRAFAHDDASRLPCVVVVNRTLANLLGGPQEALFSKVAPVEGAAPGDCAIVGVAQDARDFRVMANPTPQVYFLSGLASEPNPTLLIRAKPGVEPSSVLRAAIGDYTGAPVNSSLWNLEGVSAMGSARERLLGYVMLCFGICSVGVALLGVAGMVSSRLGAARHQIGIRLALGQRPPGAAAVYLWDCALAGALGLAVGVVVAATYQGSMRALVPEMSPATAASYAIVGAGWCGVAFAVAATSTLAIGRRPLVELLRS
jgi:putative ABC transport system permease protein